MCSTVMCSYSPCVHLGFSPLPPAHTHCKLPPGYPKVLVVKMKVLEPCSLIVGLLCCTLGRALHTVSVLALEYRSDK